MPYFPKEDHQKQVRQHIAQLTPWGNFGRWEGVKGHQIQGHQRDIFLHANLPNEKIYISLYICKVDREGYATEFFGGTPLHNTRKRIRILNTRIKTKR